MKKIIFILACLVGFVSLTSFKKEDLKNYTPFYYSLHHGEEILGSIKFDSLFQITEVDGDVKVKINKRYKRDISRIYRDWCGIGDFDFYVELFPTYYKYAKKKLGNKVDFDTLQAMSKKDRYYLDAYILPDIIDEALDEYIKSKGIYRTDGDKYYKIANKFLLFCAIESCRITGDPNSARNFNKYL